MSLLLHTIPSSPIIYWYCSPKNVYFLIHPWTTEQYFGTPTSTLGCLAYSTYSLDLKHCCFSMSALPPGTSLYTWHQQGGNFASSSSLKSKSDYTGSGSLNSSVSWVISSVNAPSFSLASFRCICRLLASLCLIHSPASTEFGKRNSVSVSFEFFTGDCWAHIWVSRLISLLLQIYQWLPISLGCCVWYLTHAASEHLRLIPDSIHCYQAPSTSQGEINHA